MLPHNPLPLQPQDNLGKIAMSQRIRIKLQSYDHNLVDKSAEKIVKTVRSTGAVVTGPIPYLHTNAFLLYYVHRMRIRKVVSSSN